MEHKFYVKVDLLIKVLMQISFNNYNSDIV